MAPQAAAAVDAGRPHGTDGRPVIDVRGVVKTYPLAAGDFTALAGIDLRVSAGEFVAVVGRSGSGRTTLHHEWIN
jgi:ABC-type glutathione transport system ATPase component